MSSGAAVEISAHDELCAVTCACYHPQVQCRELLSLTPHKTCPGQGHGHARTENFTVTELFMWQKGDR